jgi:two-component system, NarL family, response regulator YdfI
VSAELLEAPTSEADGDELVALIVDDHALVRSGLRLLLESSFGARVHEADGHGAALRTLAERSIDVALLDLRMPDVDGLETLASIRNAHPDIPVVMLSAYADTEEVRAALDGGAAGFVLKEATREQLREAIVIAIEGRGVYVHPVAAKALLGQREVEHGEHLTERELDVLTLLAEGETNDTIAKRLHLTEKTVKSHLSAIFRKLGVSNRTQAATRALRDGLLSS